MATTAREEFATQVNSEILASVRDLAQSEGRQIQSLVDEALADAAAKGLPRPSSVKVQIGEFTREIKTYRSVNNQIKAMVTSIEGAHSVPQAFGKQLPDSATASLPGGKYNPDAAFVVPTSKPIHTTMDQPWKDAFRALRDSGQKEASGQWVFDRVADGIRNHPDLSAAEKMSRVARLHDEMFVELGLNPTATFEIPRILTLEELLSYIARRKGK